MILCFSRIAAASPVRVNSPVSADNLRFGPSVASPPVSAYEPPSNAHIAGQGGLSVGAIDVDRNNPRACWIWVVTDNLRLSAENAVAVAKEYL